MLEEFKKGNIFIDTLDYTADSDLMMELESLRVQENIPIRYRDRTRKYILECKAKGWHIFFVNSAGYIDAFRLRVPERMLNGKMIVKVADFMRQRPTTEVVGMKMPNVD